MHCFSLSPASCECFLISAAVFQIYNLNNLPSVLILLIYKQLFKVIEYFYIYIYTFGRRVYQKIFQGTHFTFSVLAFPGKRTHDLGVASTNTTVWATGKLLEGIKPRSEVVVLCYV